MHACVWLIFIRFVVSTRQAFCCGIHFFGCFLIGSKTLSLSNDVHTEWNNNFFFCVLHSYENVQRCARTVAENFFLLSRWCLGGAMNFHFCQNKIRICTSGRMPFELMKLLFVTGGPRVSQNWRIWTFIEFIVSDETKWFSSTETENTLFSHGLWRSVPCDCCDFSTQMWVVSATVRRPTQIMDIIS